MLSVELARFINTLTFKEIPVEVTEQLRWRLLEGVIIALASSPESLNDETSWSDSVSSAVRSPATPGAASDETPSGAQQGAQALDEQTLLPELSALANGLLLDVRRQGTTYTDHLHAFDSAILPAAWGSAEAYQADGKKLMEVLAAGYATSATLAALLADEPEHPWYAGMSSGTIGAAAAAAKARGLTEQATRHALGLAADQAMRLAENARKPSSSCKSQEQGFRDDDLTDVPGPGRAAMDGVLCVSLAASGAPSFPDTHEQLQALWGRKHGAEPMEIVWFPDVAASEISSVEDIEQRFMTLVGRESGQAKARALLESVRSLEALPAGQLMAYLMGRKGRPLQS